MAFRISRAAKRQGEARLWSEDELIWGVPRRPGYDDQDDPKGHAGLTQHAFELGNDERAICGFEPPKRATGPTAKPRPQLAVPSTRLNPRCAKCARVIATPTTPVPPPALAAIEAAAAAEAAPAAEASTPAQASPADQPAGRSVADRAPKTVKPEPAPTESWEGTATFGASDVVVVVRPPRQPGLGVVASVVSGPAGTRVASVNINADGMAVITLSEPARAPVTVAWFAVPSVDHAPAPEPRPEAPPDHTV